jgi:dTMP kinase
VPSDSSNGRLIALEGASGPDFPGVGNKLVRSLLKPKQEGGVSQFDASGIFFELRKGEKNIPQPSPRTLLLLYAADLVFRLRWEIKPALDEGYVVVAAPYVESAIAFGKAAGLPRRWLVDLFRFAPKPDACYRLKEKRDIDIWKFKRSEGYLEFCCKTLLKSSPIWQPVELRERVLAYLEAMEKRGVCETVSDKILSR